MTHMFIAISLLLTTPIAPAEGMAGAETAQPRVVARTTQRLGHWPKELIWQSSPPVAPTADIAPTTWPSDPPILTDQVSPPVSSAPIESPALVVALPEPTIPLSLRERALNRLSELGATPWMIGTFDCIGFRESTWRNVASTTGDVGVFQINQVHNAELWRRGLDPWVPEDAATFAWSLSRWGTTFKPWSVHALCGV